MGPGVHVFLISGPGTVWACPRLINRPVDSQATKPRVAVLDKGLKAGPDGIVLQSMSSLCSASAARDLVRAPKLSRQITCYDPTTSAVDVRTVHGDRELFLYHLTRCGFFARRLRPFQGRVGHATTFPNLSIRGLCQPKRKDHSHIPDRVPGGGNVLA